MLRYIYLLMNSTYDVWECVQVIFIPSSWGRLNPKRNKDHSSDTLIASLQALLSEATSLEIFHYLRSLLSDSSQEHDTVIMNDSPDDYYRKLRQQYVCHVYAVLLLWFVNIYFTAPISTHGILIQDKHIVNYSYTLDNKVCSVKLC